MIKGVGFDIIEPERMAEAIKKPHFMERMYTEGERARIAEAGNMAPQRAAGIFAGKEATLKALGCGFSGVGFHDVEILSAASGRPYICMHGRAAEKLEAIGADRLHISISHIASAAAAFVILEGD